MVLFIIMGGCVDRDATGVSQTEKKGRGPDFSPPSSLFTHRYYVNQKSVPVALQWIQNVSMIKYAFEALCINEFEGLRFETDSAPSAASIATGEQVRLASN